MAELKWNTDSTDNPLNGLAIFGEQAQKALTLYCDTAAQKLESEAKVKRPWTDRSNLARESLRGSFEVSAESAEIVLSHGVDYGIWLELANEKNYAIVEPTVRLNANEIMNGMENMLDKIHVK